MKTANDWNEDFLKTKIHTNIHKLPATVAITVTKPEAVVKVRGQNQSKGYEFDPLLE